MGAAREVSRRRAEGGLDGAAGRAAECVPWGGFPLTNGLVDEGTVHPNAQKTDLGAVMPQ